MASATAAPAAPTAADGDLMLSLYRRMRLIRRFEEAVHSLFLKGEVHGTTHLYNGEEASATGVGSVLTPDDRVAGTYRGHGHALSSASPQGLLDELLGRATGVCGGRAGSMNVIDLEHGLIGCFGIVGGSSRRRRRLAGAARHRQRRRRVLRRRRDQPGLLPRVPQLRARPRCRPSSCARTTSTASSRRGSRSPRARSALAPRARLAYEHVDGMDVWARAPRAARRRARPGGRGPVFLETMTYRFVGHSRSDPGVPQAGRARALAGARPAAAGPHG